jgi:hypothetical protein
MAPPDRRLTMSVADFANIPMHDSDTIDGYYQALIVGNKHIDDEVYEHMDTFQELTTGQRMLIELATFDSQVKNGGLTQFFWNSFPYCFDVHDWIDLLQLPALRDNYSRALESLVGKKDDWFALREECYKSPDGPRWELFQRTYALLDLGWFDKAYFDSHEVDEDGKWVKKSTGLHHGLLLRLAEYVRQNPREFIAT